MEPVALVISALVAGVTAGLTTTTETVIGEAYQTLKRLVIGRLASSGTDEQTRTALVEKITESEATKMAMSQALTSAGVDDPTREAAQRLLDLLQPPSKYVVDASQAKGVQIGDHTIQHNTFN